MTRVLGPRPPMDRPTHAAARHPRPSRPWLWFPVAVYAASIFIVSAMSRPPGSGSVSDKPAHMAAYAGLGLLTLRAVAGGEWAGVTAARSAVAVTIVTLYGASDELHQASVPGRTADVRDLAADAAGATASIAATWLLARARRSGR
jgi:VanZ family protein